MAEYLRVARVDEIPVGENKLVTIGDREVAIFNVDGAFYAIDNACPHQGGPLNEGWTDDAIVSCPWHGWCFDVRTGRMTLGEYATVDTFDVRLEGDTLAVATEPRPET